MTEPILRIESICRDFGGLRALDNVSFDLQPGTITALIGPNGAGKTTLFNCLTGFIPVSKGRVTYKGRDITNWSAHAVTKLGIARTFQVVQVLEGMSATENVMVGAFLRERSTARARQKAQGVLEQVGLGGQMDALARDLSIPSKKRMEVAMSLVTGPEVLMLDEAMAGLNPSEFKEVQDLIRKLKAEGMTLMVVEHVMEAIMPICDRVVVLEAGKTIAEGTAQEVAANPEVIKAYLGERYACNRQS
jgi:branched-chain amino acid transport system ATP-binding protein